MSETAPKGPNTNKMTKRQKIAVGAGLLTAVAGGAAGNEIVNSGTDRPPAATAAPYEQGETIRFMEGKVTVVKDAEDGGNQTINAPIIDRNGLGIGAFDAVVDGEQQSYNVTRDEHISGGDGSVAVVSGPGVGEDETTAWPSGVDGKKIDNTHSAIMENTVTGTVIGVDQDGGGVDVRMPDGSERTVGEQNPQNP